MTPSTPFWETVAEGALAQMIGSVIVVGLAAAVRSVRRSDRQSGNEAGDDQT